VAADELTKALLLEEVATPRAIADALFASVNGGVPLLQALVDAGAATPETLSRYLARSEAPFLRQVLPVTELVEKLPPGLCGRLLAIPVRRDAITGTIDVVVADPADPHPASEMAFHLKAPVRVVRAPIQAIEEALRRLRMLRTHATMTTRAQNEARERFQEAARAAAHEDERLYDSRPRAPSAYERMQPLSHSPFPAPVRPNTGSHPSLPPPNELLSHAMPSHDDVPPRRGGLVIEPDSAPPPAAPPPTRMRTPPWGTPLHMIEGANIPKGTDPPRSGYGSEIPIPLTRRTIGPAPPPQGAARNAPQYALPSLPSFSSHPVSSVPSAPPPQAPPMQPAHHAQHPSMQPNLSPFRGGTQRPPALIDPSASPLGEGYAFDTTNLRDVVEKTASPRIEMGATSNSVAMPPMGQPIGSFIPGPPPLPGMGQFAAYSPQLPFPEMGGILAALRNAGSRDEVLELVLTGARMVALKVALFVVKKGGYLGWVGTPEFADRASLQSVLIPLEANSIFDRAVREDLYLGPIRYDEVHAPLLRVIRNPSRDVAAVPIRVSGKTAVIIVADELGDTMIGTRRLEELARAAGEAFARIVRTRR